MLNIINSFLSNRVQRVKIDNVISTPAAMSSGVPQGSVLGPLLFLIYVNDLSECLPRGVHSKLFADDAKLYTRVKEGCDIDNFQTALDSIADWSHIWQMPIAISKCFTLNLLCSNNDDYYSNNIGGIEIVNVNDTCDLGVLVDDKLSFISHIASVVFKSKLRISQIFKCFTTNKYKDLLQGYKAYVLPLVTYCSSVWNPACKQDILKLESVQK